MLSAWGQLLQGILTIQTLTYITSFLHALPFEYRNPGTGGMFVAGRDHRVPQEHCPQHVSHIIVIINKVDTEQV